MDGCDLLRHIREDFRCEAIPIIVLTGSSADRFRTEAHRLGISAFINKIPDVQALSDHLTLFKHLLQTTHASTAGS